VKKRPPLIRFRELHFFAVVVAIEEGGEEEGTEAGEAEVLNMLLLLLLLLLLLVVVVVVVSRSAVPSRALAFQIQNRFFRVSIEGVFSPLLSVVFGGKRRGLTTQRERETEPINARDENRIPCSLLLLARRRLLLLLLLLLLLFPAPPPARVVVVFVAARG
jgi:hypothetical protein